MRVQTPASHKNDPSTSFEAEEKMNQGKRFTHQAILSEMVEKQPGKTAAELGEITGLGQHECARRLSEINGVTVERGDRRRCRVKGTMMMTWQPLDRAGG